MIAVLSLGARRLGLSALLVLVLVVLLVPLPGAHAATTRRILITGDSITQGSSGDYTWRYRLWSKLATTARGKVRFVGTRTDLFDVVNNRHGSQSYAAPFTANAHAAVWGDTYIGALNRISGQVARTRADVLVVMLGSNDLAYKTSPAATVANVRTYVNRARAARPGIDVVVGEVLTKYDPWSQKYQLGPQVDEYATRLDALAGQLDSPRERFVVARTRTGWDAAKHTWDGAHPNPTGEALIAQRFSEGLARIGIGSAAPDITGVRAWSVSGPVARLSPGSEQVALSWNRSATGATGMYVFQRLLNDREPWRRLPYAIAGNGWTAKQLVAGGTYQFRLVPVKGSNVGRPGAVASVVVGGPKPGSIRTMKAAAGGASTRGGQKAPASWAVAKNATAYLVANRMMSSGRLVWDDLPYPVTRTSWTFEPLFQGRRYQFRVRAAHGFLRSPWKGSAVTRMNGWPANEAQVSLGDSYSSGLGSDEKYLDKGCHRSRGAWAFGLNRAFGGLSLLACAGAEIPDVKRQLPAMDTFFAARKGRPELITLTVGGNDLGFSRVLARCIRHACADDEYNLTRDINEFGSTLGRFYRDLRRAHPHADIIVGGYPGLLERDGGSKNPLCLRIGWDERDMINQLAARLNRVIAAAARDAGLWTVGQRVRDEFAGHNACKGGASEWIHAGNWDLGGDHGVIDARSFHPKDIGQAHYAKVFRDAIRSFER